MPVISISMPENLLSRLDDFAAEHDYSGRSEAVRNGTRKLLSEFDDDHIDEAALAGIVTVVYDIESRCGQRRVASIRHDHDEQVASYLHSHVDDCCLDLFVIDGGRDVVSTFVNQVRTVDEVETVEYSMLALEPTELGCAD